jgi:hypothetical protein
MWDIGVDGEMSDWAVYRVPPVEMEVDDTSGWVPVRMQGLLVIERPAAITCLPLTYRRKSVVCACPKSGPVNASVVEPDPEPWTSPVFLTDSTKNYSDLILVEHVLSLLLKG